MKICHITSVHKHSDIRIFIKECSSLAQAGYQVSLVVADGQGDKIRNNIHIYDAGTLKNRVRRMIQGGHRVFTIALRLDADVYHFHDPELILVGLALRMCRKKVIYDAHEDYSTKILSKGYLPRLVRKPLSKVFSQFERFAARRFNANVAATPQIAEQLPKNNTVIIRNFPIMSELASESSVAWAERSRSVVYIGATITRVRGISEMVKAIGMTNDVKLKVAGTFPEILLAEVSSLEGWEYVDVRGFLSRNQLKELLLDVRCGLVTLHPTPAYIDSLPVKLFEYMAAGVPVIASDFPVWRQIIEKYDCGILVDPLNPKSIASAIDRIISDDIRAKTMGENGRRAVETEYNWATESLRLLNLYEQVLSTC